MKIPTGLGQNFTISFIINDAKEPVLHKRALQSGFAVPLRIQIQI